jgi:hypothetical protein
VLPFLKKVDIVKVSCERLPKYSSCAAGMMKFSTEEVNSPRGEGLYSC